MQRSWPTLTLGVFRCSCLLWVGWQVPPLKAMAALKPHTIIIWFCSVFNEPADHSPHQKPGESTLDRKHNFRKGPLVSSWFFLKGDMKAWPRISKNLKSPSFGDWPSLSIIMVWWMEMECLCLEPPRLIGYWVNCFHLVLVCHSCCLLKTPCI